MYDIHICLVYNQATFYPIFSNYMGNLIDALIESGESKYKIIHTMHFFYGQINQNIWNDVARSENDKPIRGTIHMMTNPRVKLLGKEGLFHLSFWGHDKIHGAFCRAKNFEELLEMEGLRKAVPIPFNDELSPSTKSGIPSRIEISRY